LIQEYRELAKLFSTYIEALPKLINPKTKRIHTSFNQTVTSTGRLSSSDPNLQNIPIKTELGREIRKAFVAEKGYKLLALDYSQIELRLAAHFSGDKKMVEAFKNGLDIHTATAAEINGVKLEEVTKEMRREAKAINFGILYGQGPHGLSQTADIPYNKAREFIDDYFAHFGDIKKYIDDSIKLARDKGYAETLFGRRRYLPEINSSVVMVRKGAERMAINAPLQGTSADMIKVAMIRIQSELNTNGSVKMLLQVHDELVFEVREDFVKETAEKIKKIMENVIKLKVPIVVDVKVGENWGAMSVVESKKL
jgi:DNA polymerase-1